MTQKPRENPPREGKKRQRRVIKVTKITCSRRPDGGVQYKTTVPSWVVEKFLGAKIGDSIEWDFFKGNVIIRLVEPE